MKLWVAITIDVLEAACFVLALWPGRSLPLWIILSPLWGAVVLAALIFGGSFVGLVVKFARQRAMLIREMNKNQ